MTGETLAILGVGLTAIVFTASLLMSIRSAIDKMGSKMESQLNNIDFRLAEQNKKLDKIQG